MYKIYKFIKKLFKIWEMELSRDLVRNSKLGLAGENFFRFKRVFFVDICLAEHLSSDRHSNLECKFCNKTFADSKHLKEHMKRIHLVTII